MDPLISTSEQIIDAPTRDAGFDEALRTASCAGVKPGGVSPLVFVNMFSCLNELYWIILLSMEQHFVVKVRTRAAPGRTHGAELIADFDVLAFLGHNPSKVSIS